MRKIAIFILILATIFTVEIISCFADVSVKMVIVNSSEDEEKDVPVKYYLPPSITKDDVLNAGGLEVDFDVAKSAYYVHGDVKLSPKESRTLKVVLRDIWRVPEEEINDLIIMLDSKVGLVQDEERLETAELISNSIKERLAAILAEQEALAANVEKRMQGYVVNVEKVQAIKDEIFALERMIEMGGEPEEVEGTVTLSIEAENILDRSIEAPVKFYLPREVIPEYIVDKKDFDVKYDYDEEKFYLIKDEKFEAKEIKNFDVKVKNIWQVSDQIVDGYVSEASELIQRFAGTLVEAIGLTLLKDIEANAELIKTTQVASDIFKDHVSSYRVNQKRISLIEDDLERLRTLASKIQEESKITKESSKIQNVLRQMESFSKIKKLSDKVFQRLQRVAVWKIINWVVIFVIAITVFFYGLWFMSLKKEEKQKLEKVVPKESEKK